MSGKWIVTLLSICFCASARSSCPPVPSGLTELFKPGYVVLIGEIHGTREMPERFASAVCHARQTGLPLKVGLELPADELSGVATWMGSSGSAEDQARLLQAEFWRKDYQDGRASRAMFALLRTLRNARDELSVFTFDRQTKNRDRAMADRILSQASDDTLTLVLTGNIHSRTTIGAPWDDTFETMGSVIKTSIPKTVGVALRHTGGAAWVCAPECGVREMGSAETPDADKFVRTDGHHTRQWQIGAIHASPPMRTRKVDARQQWTEVCKDWDDWDKPGPAFRIHANTYYVGTCGIGAILIAGDKGHVLIDSGTAAGAKIVADNVTSLGFNLSDIKILLHSHEHFDHVGGIAELQRLSGGELYASAQAAPVLASGNDAPSDPQYGLHGPFAAARVDHIVADGQTIRLGRIRITAVYTPGHTAGALSWHWKSCAAGRCEDLVYADSLSPVSRDDYRFSDHPEYVLAYREGLKKLSQLACSVLVTPHPSASAMRSKLAAGSLADPMACSDYASAVGNRLTKRLQKEAAGDRGL